VIRPPTTISLNLDVAGFGGGRYPYFTRADCNLPFAIVILHLSAFRNGVENRTFLAISQKYDYDPD